MPKRNIPPLSGTRINFSTVLKHEILGNKKENRSVNDCWNIPSWSDPKWVTREKGCFPNVIQTTEKHHHTLQSYTEPTVWRCTISVISQNTILQSWEKKPCFQNIKQHVSIILFNNKRKRVLRIRTHGLKFKCITSFQENIFNLMCSVTVQGICLMLDNQFKIFDKSNP